MHSPANFDKDQAATPAELMIADSVHFFGDEEQKAGAVGGLHLFEAMGSLRVKAFELGSGAMVARYIYIYIG